MLETADHLTEVTESVDYFVQGRTIAAGNLFGRLAVPIFGCLNLFFMELAYWTAVFVISSFSL